MFLIIYTIILLFVCIAIYRKIKEKNKHPMTIAIVTYFITAILGSLFIPSNLSDLFILNHIAYFQEKSDKNHKLTNSNDLLQQNSESDANEKAVTVGNYSVQDGKSVIPFTPPYDGKYVIHLSDISEEQIAGLTITDKEGSIQNFSSTKDKSGYEIKVENLIANEDYKINISIDQK